MAQVEFRNKYITRQQVLEEIRRFDEQYLDTNQYKGWLDSNSYHFALELDGKLYPPKHLLSEAARVPVKDFSGGEETNNVLRSLGFTIINKLGSDRK